MLNAWRTTFALLAIGAALAAPAAAQESAKPQESPRAPAAAPQGAPTRSAPQPKTEKATPQQQAFARKVVDAMYSKDYAAMAKLFAPSTLKCIGKNQDFLHDRIRREFDLPINKNYRLTITRLPPNVMIPNTYTTYPMSPTHLMGLEFSTESGDTATVTKPIGQERGKWYEVQPCPTQLGMQRFAKLQHAREAGLAKAKAAMPRVQEPLKSQLLALIAKRDTADAWKLCMSSMHVDFSTAHGIVAILAGEETN
ncbi:MAG: hypothetical protein WBQ86_02615 [Candidatus Binatus sp.]